MNTFRVAELTIGKSHPTARTVIWYKYASNERQKITRYVLVPFTPLTQKGGREEIGSTVPTSRGHAFESLAQWALSAIQHTPQWPTSVDHGGQRHTARRLG